MCGFLSFLGGSPNVVRCVLTVMGGTNTFMCDAPTVMSGALTVMCYESTLISDAPTDMSDTPTLMGGVRPRLCATSHVYEPHTTIHLRHHPPINLNLN